MSKIIELDGIKYELVPIKEEEKEDEKAYPERPKVNEVYFYVSSLGVIPCINQSSETDVKIGNCFFGENAEKQAKAYNMLLNKVWEIREKYGEIENNERCYRLTMECKWSVDFFNGFDIYCDIHERLGLILNRKTTEQEREEVKALLLAVYKKDFSLVDKLKLLD